MKRKSKYVYERDTGNSLFLLNLLTFNYIFLNKKDKKLWKENKLNDINDLEILEKLFFVVENDKVLFDYAIKILAKKGSLNPHHVIYITDECNQRCSYCFESSVDILGKKKKALNNEQISKIINTIVKINKARNKENNITIFGGEPLLEKNKNVVQYLLQEIQSKGINQVDIVTNGLTLLSFAKLLHSYNNCIGTIIITLTGYKDIHDSVRGTINEPTFDKIINNIKEFLNCTSNINVRLNLMLNKKNIDKMNKLLLYLKKQEISTNQRVTLVFGRIQFRVDPQNVQYQDELEYPEYYSSIFKYYYENDLVNDDMICGSEVAILSKLYKFWKNKKLAFPWVRGCSAVYPGRFCYFIDDNIYPCTEIAGLKKFSIGNYMNDGIDMQKFQKWSTYKVTELESCKSCKYIGLCNGACPVSNITSKGDLNNVLCLEIEKSLDKFIDILYMKGFFNKKNEI